jgi:signal peptidase I
MGNRGKPRSARSAAEDLLPTGSRRTGGPVLPGRAERRKLARRVKRRRQRSAIKEIPLLIGVALLIALVLKTFLVQAFVIPSGSMEQTIRIGDRVLVDKLTPWFGSKPERGDVVVFKDPGGWLEDEQPVAKADDPIVVKQVKEVLTFIGLLPSDNERDLIKRVVAVGGDTVKCCDTQGRVTVNGMPLNEPYINPGDKPSSLNFDGEGARGAPVGHGRPPLQLRRLPLSPYGEVQRHHLRGRRGPRHGHRLAHRSLEPTQRAGNVCLRARRARWGGRCARRVA